jgi:ParB-like chromosome segregation protein Spo0J
MLLTWDGDNSEIEKIEMADLQYPILIFVNDQGDILSIIDGHHRAQKAIRRGLDTIKCKLIPINSLPKHMRLTFKHIN